LCQITFARRRPGVSNEKQVPTSPVFSSAFFSLALLAPSLGLAQDDEKEKAQKQTERRLELERKTLAMLDEVATQALSLKLPENRSFVLAAAADLLWTQDEKRARNLFWDALNNLTSTYNPNTGEEKGA
jgi:hypothetical protein